MMMREAIEEIIREAYEKYGEPEIKIDVDEEYYIVSINTENPYVDIIELSDIIEEINEKFLSLLLRQVNSKFQEDYYIMYLEPYEYEGT